MPFAPRTAVMKAMLERMESQRRLGSYWVDPNSMDLRRGMPQQEPNAYTPPVTGGLPGFSPSFNSRIMPRDISPSQGGLGFGFFMPEDLQPVSLARFVGSAARSAGSAAVSVAREAQRQAARAAAGGLHAGAGLVGAPMGPGFTPVQASSGEPKAFIVHHTGPGIRTIADVERVLKERGYGVQYAMDRNGTIKVIGGPGAHQMRRGTGPGLGLSNANVVGMEVIAGDDSEVTPAQVAAMQDFMKAYYPNIPSFGHGEVNPGHKLPTEGMTIVNALRTATMQTRLNAMGENVPVDGIMGPATRAAMQKHGITSLPTGYTPATGGAATSAADPQVAALQQALKAQDPSIVVDGIMGPQTRAAIAKYPSVAAAYAPAPAATTPALQAATQQATGVTRSGGAISRSGPEVAALQRNLNSLGAKLKVDGLEGPLTRAAAQQFMGSPTSVRTPSFTTLSQPVGQTPWAPARPATPNALQAPRMTKEMLQPPSTLPARIGGLPPLAAGGFVRQAAPQVPTASVPKTPAFMNPYTMSSGGASALQAPRMTREMLQPPSALPARMGGLPPLAAGGFVQQQVPIARTPQTPSGTYFSSPYTSSTGGANAIQAPRIPQPRPAYYPPVQSGSTGGTLMQQLQQAQMLRDAAARQEAARRESMRSGYSGGYSGGTFGGYGGGSLTSGVGGAFRNR